MYGHDEQLGSHSGWEVTAAVDTAESSFYPFLGGWGGEIVVNQLKRKGKSVERCGVGTGGELSYI